MIKSFLRKIAQNNNTRSFIKKEIDDDIKIRLNKNTVPSILNIEHVKKLCNELKNPIENEKEFLLYQFKNRILPGVDETSKIKASFLKDIIYNKQHSPVINRTDAINILGTMQGGYNVEIMIIPSMIFANGPEKTIDKRANKLALLKYPFFLPLFL